MKIFFSRDLKVNFREVSKSMKLRKEVSKEACKI